MLNCWRVLILLKIKINRNFAISKIEMLFWNKPDIRIRLFYNRIIRNTDPASKSLSGTVLVNGIVVSTQNTWTWYLVFSLNLKDVTGSKFKRWADLSLCNQLDYLVLKIFLRVNMMNSLMKNCVMTNRNISSPHFLILT